MGIAYIRMENVILLVGVLCAVNIRAGIGLRYCDGFCIEINDYLLVGDTGLLLRSPSVPGAVEFALHKSFILVDGS